jgi:hypothetical protein
VPDSPSAAAAGAAAAVGPVPFVCTPPCIRLPQPPPGLQRGVTFVNNSSSMRQCCHAAKRGAFLCP